MNFLRMRLDADGKRLHGDFGTIDLPQGLLAAAQGYRDRDLWVGVRPEHLSISTTDTSTDVLAGTTELIEPLGSAIEIQVHVGGSTIIAQIARDSPVRVGEALKLPVDTTHLPLFHIDTDANLLQSEEGPV